MMNIKQPLPTTQKMTNGILSDCPTELCSLAVINNLLTIIGGMSSGWGGKVTNQLLSLTREGRSKKYRELGVPTNAANQTITINSGL